MGKWDNVGSAKASGDSLPNIFMGEPIGTRGEFLVDILRTKDVEGRTGDLFFIIEFKVIESSHSSVLEGRDYSQVIKYNQDMGPINVKRFVLAANDMDPNDEENEDEVDGETVEYVLSEEQPLAGKQMPLTCEVVKTKKKGEAFTKHTWHANEEDDENSDSKDKK
jgi:hypothetical protein